MGMVWEACGLPGSQSFVEQIQVNSLEDSAFSEFRPSKICMWSAWWYSECSEISCDKLRWSWWFFWCFPVFFFGGRFLLKAKKTFELKMTQLPQWFAKKRIENIIQWTIIPMRSLPSTRNPHEMQPTIYRGKIHHTWLLSSPNITGQFMGLQVFPLSLRYRDKKVNSPFRCAKKRTPRENRTVNILWRMADHKYPHKYRPPACNTGVLKHRNTLTPHGILSKIFVGVIEKSDESRDWNLLKYRNYRWTTAQKFLLTAQIWSRFMTCWDHPHCHLVLAFQLTWINTQLQNWWSADRTKRQILFGEKAWNSKDTFFLLEKTISICLGGANHKQDYD